MTKITSSEFFILPLLTLFLTSLSLIYDDVIIVNPRWGHTCDIRRNAQMFWIDPRLYDIYIHVKTAMYLVDNFVGILEKNEYFLHDKLDYYFVVTLESSDKDINDHNWAVTMLILKNGRWKISQKRVHFCHYKYSNGRKLWNEFYLLNITRNFRY